jgi:predicted N-acyltransferase
MKNKLPNKIMTRKNKIELLRHLIELKILLNYDINNLVGQPLSNFDWEAVYKHYENTYNKYLSTLN